MNMVHGSRNLMRSAQHNHLFCQACDYKAVTDVHLQEHIKMKHEPSCKFCELKFESIESLEKHTCKQNIINAEFKQFYTKNWILTHGCSAVFNKQMQQEVAILHNHNCWAHVCPCRELPGWHTGDTLSDANGIVHVERKEFVVKGVIRWSALCEEM